MQSSQLNPWTLKASFMVIRLESIIFQNFLIMLFGISSAYVTGPGKTGLIYRKYTCLYHGTYLLFCMCYPKSVNFIEFLMDFCICDDVLHTIQITDKKLLHFKLSKLGQILCVDRTCFPRPGHIYNQLKPSGDLQLAICLHA